MIIDTDQLFKCETCRWHGPLGCNSYCDHMEGYSPNINKLKPVDLEALGYVKIEGISKEYHTLTIDNTFYIKCPECAMYINTDNHEDKMFVTCPNCGKVIKKLVRGKETL